MNGFRTYHTAPGGMMPQVVKTLLIANGIIFLLTSFGNIAFSAYLGLIPKYVWSRFMIWQLFTYMFLHGNFWHILMNMFILWMFGSDLERNWGSREFLKYYIICGVGAGLFNVILQPNAMIPIIGASGAIYGLLVAFAIMYPNRLVYVYFLFPVRVKYLVMFLVIMEFIFSMMGSQGNIAHFAHLGGALVGYLYIKSNFGVIPFKSRIKNIFYRHKIERRSREFEREQKLMEDVDRILDKINQVGYDKLTRREKKMLEDASERLSKK